MKICRSLRRYIIVNATFQKGVSAFTIIIFVYLVFIYYYLFIRNALQQWCASPRVALGTLI